VPPNISPSGATTIALTKKLAEENLFYAPLKDLGFSWWPSYLARIIHGGKNHFAQVCG